MRIPSNSRRPRERSAVFALIALVAINACGGNGGEPAEAPAAPGEPAAQSAPADAAANEDFHLGEPRDDLERFHGLYGEPGRGQFFVTQAKRPVWAERAPEIPPGYLAIGAMWGDVAPMDMKSLADNRFEQVDRGDFAPDTPNVAEFDIGPDGNAVALNFTQGGFSDFGRRERVGDLPEGFE